MAIRYCGDLEIRMTEQIDGCEGSIRWPSGRVLFQSPRSTRKNLDERYDHLAKAAVQKLLSRKPGLPVEYDNNNKIIIRRTFQAPCPLED